VFHLNSDWSKIFFPLDWRSLYSNHSKDFFAALIMFISVFFSIPIFIIIFFQINSKLRKKNKTIEIKESGQLRFDINNISN
jgi:hypothetical protein